MFDYELHIDRLTKTSLRDEIDRISKDSVKSIHITNAATCASLTISCCLNLFAKPIDKLEVAFTNQLLAELLKHAVHVECITIDWRNDFCDYYKTIDEYMRRINRPFILRIFDNTSNKRQLAINHISSTAPIYRLTYCCGYRSDSVVQELVGDYVNKNDNVVFLTTQIVFAYAHRHINFYLERNTALWTVNTGEMYPSFKSKLAKNRRTYALQYLCVLKRTRINSGLCWSIWLHFYRGVVGKVYDPIKFLGVE